MREAASLVVLALACGSALRAPMGCRPPVAAANAADSKEAATAATVAAVPSAALNKKYESLAARGPAVAPGMREIARKESAGDRVEIARATGRDACVRVAFEADSPVVAKLLDAEGHVLAATERASTDGVLGPGGPVCIRKGDAVSALAEGAGTSVRWVGWEAP